MPILSGFAPRGGQWRRRQRRAPVVHQHAWI